MSIAILCPNGHKLICPEQQAGKRGKCPQCGATFRVPELVGAAAAPSTLSGPASLSGAGSGPIAAAVQVAQPVTPVRAMPVPVNPQPRAEAPAPQPAVVATPPGNPIRPYEEGPHDEDDAIAFLCPNGHHLCGPSSLGGRAGECPVCGTKFLVPSEEDLSPEAEQEVEAADHHAADEAEAHAESAPTDDQRSLSELFDSFWAYKEPGIAIELHLASGKVLAPDGYAPHLSRQGHGVFMVKEPNGSYTLAAITWSSIAQVTVRGVRQLPEGVFDLG